MLDIKGDIEKKKAEKESLEAIEPKEEENKPTADEKLKEDFEKAKGVVTKVTAPVKAVWHFIPDSVKTVLGLGLGGGGIAAGIANAAKEKAKEVTGK